MNYVFHILSLIWPYTSAITFPVVEFFVFIFIACAFFSTRVRIIDICSMIILPLIVLLLSDTTSLEGSVRQTSGQILFYMKYFLLFSCVILSKKNFGMDLKDFHIRMIKYGIFLFAVATIYEWYANFDLFFRASTPGTARFKNTGDSHLLSAISSLLLIAQFEFFSKQRFFIISSILLSVVIIISGSRTGVLSIGIYLLLNPSKVLRLVRDYGLLLILIITYVVTVWGKIIFEFMNSTLMRLLRFGLTEDRSSILRLRKLFLAFDESAVKGFLLGSGPIFAQNFWYDNTLAMWISHFGLLFGLIMFFYVFSRYGVLKNQSFSVVVVVISQAIISDYIMTTKYLFIIIIFNMLVQNSIKKQLECTRPT